MLTKYRQEKGNDHESWEDFLNFIPSFALMRSEKPMLYWSRQDDIQLLLSIYKNGFGKY